MVVGNTRALRRKAAENVNLSNGLCDGSKDIEVERERLRIVLGDTMGYQQ